MFDLLNQMKYFLLNLYRIFKYRFLPNHNHHIIDIRKAKPSYHYGWVDADVKIEYAMFAILIDFVGNEFDRINPSDEEVAMDDGNNINYIGFKKQRAYCNEILDIHHYWTVERPQEEIELNK